MMPPDATCQGCSHHHATTQSYPGPGWGECRALPPGASIAGPGGLCLTYIQTKDDMPACGMFQAKRGALPPVVETKAERLMKIYRGMERGTDPDGTKDFA